ncbi:ABC transporter substrate-binding protein [Streptomyces sp. NPDC053499]|uniref:ABC transporter substrate-binding protein n=1 Tax=Streptomyces sp. NPDC053499 TaxID=3365707 RepID=UPI0037CDFA90
MRSTRGPGTKWGKTFAPAARDAFTYGGKQYGVPINLDAKVFAYNKKVFADAEVKKPTSFQELLKTCDTLDKAGYTPIAFGNKHGWPAIHYMTQLNAQWVPGKVRDADYKPSGGKFTDPGYVRALKSLKELSKRCFTGQANGVAHESAQATLFQGESAMQFVETFEFPLLSAKDVPKSFKDNWSFFRMPASAGAPGDQEALVGAPDGLLVNPKSKNAGLAVDFLKFFTSKQNASLMTEMNDWLSPVQGSADGASPQNKEALKMISGTKNFAVWLDTVTHTQVAQAYLSGVEGLLDGSLTPEEVMAKVREAAKKARAEVGS